MNCYIAILRPFLPEERKSEKAHKCELNSIKNGICGMGWNPDDSFWKAGKNIINDMSISYDTLNYGKGWKTAFNIYKEMEAGSYILTRTIDDICYVGKIVGTAYHEKGKYNFESYDNYSWIVDVDWKKIGNFMNIPNGLRGLMSGRINTVKRVTDDVHKALLEALYKGMENKIVLKEDNFCTALAPNDLEDLVALYISRENSSYMIVPSSSKVTEPKYEFKFIDMNNCNKPITCQVKNNKPVIASQYESDDLYKIYLFSGIEDYGDIDEIANNIIIIKRSELFILLKEYYNNNEFIRKQLGDIFAI